MCNPKTFSFMISEVNNELFDLCEDAVNEIATAFIDRMRQDDANEDDVIEKTVAGLSLSQRFVLSCFIMELSQNVSDMEENPLPNDKELKAWFHDQWECAQEEETELDVPE